MEIRPSDVYMIKALLFLILSLVLNGFWGPLIGIILAGLFGISGFFSYLKEENQFIFEDDEDDYETTE